MYTWEILEEILDYIEEHLEEEIKTTSLADMADLSPFYFQRIFKRIVRKPVQEYIKLRRLAMVTSQLKNTNHRILDIALNYGFSDHANFTRAFKEVYNITPDEYRKNLPLLNTFNKPEISANYINIDENVPLIIGDIVLEIQRKTLKDPEVYLGFEAEVKIDEQIPVGEITGIDVPGQLWCEFHSKKDLLRDTISDDITLGMSHSANLEKGIFLYFVGGMAISTNKNSVNGMVKQTLPAGEYVVCRIEAESFEELVNTALNQANKYLFEVWLKNHKLTTQPFSAEKYYNEEAGTYYMEIWVMLVDTAI
ncbi:AraC family transcriptional regulator [Terrisporobacter glycolicus]|uniref:AraC family transcriptional regulator n=1 Tax=Terrisporobacter glycolicus TaxID=36841 RepID=UPI000B1BFCC5